MGKHGLRVCIAAGGIGVASYPPQLTSNNNNQAIYCGHRYQCLRTNNPYGVVICSAGAFVFQFPILVLEQLAKNNAGARHKSACLHSCSPRHKYECRVLAWEQTPLEPCQFVHLAASSSHAAPKIRCSGPSLAQRLFPLASNAPSAPIKVWPSRPLTGFHQI